MSTIAPKQVFTPDALLAMPDAARFELVDGELVERNVSVLSSNVEVLVLFQLQAAVNRTKSGKVWSSSLGCRFYPDAPDKIRRPDATFVRHDRFLPEYFESGFLTIRPDIVVEVISANDTAHEVLEKIEEYLTAGVPLVWTLDPGTRIVQVHRVDGTVSKLHSSDELSGEDVFPDFRCRVADLFPLP